MSANYIIPPHEKLFFTHRGMCFFPMFGDVTIASHFNLMKLNL